MGYDAEVVMRRDNRRCRFRFPGCQGRARTIMLNDPEYLGGGVTDNNARAACHKCADQLAEHRARARELFEGRRR